MKFYTKKALHLLALPLMFSFSPQTIKANPDGTDEFKSQSALSDSLVHDLKFRDIMSSHGWFKPRSILVDIPEPVSFSSKKLDRAALFGLFPDSSSLSVRSKDVFVDFSEPAQQGLRPSAKTSSEPPLPPQSIDKKSSEAERIQKFLGLEPDSKPSAWMLPYYFVKTLFEPFIQDAPKVVEALKNEGKKMQSMGVDQYAQNVAGKTAIAVLDDPLGAITLAGGMACGFTHFFNTTSLPTIVTAAGYAKMAEPALGYGISQVPKVLEALKEEGKRLREEGVPLFVLNSGKMISKTVADVVTSDSFATAVKWGAYGAATYYLLSSLPGAAGQYTPTLQPICTLSTPGGASNPTSSSPLTNGGYVTAWQDGSNNIVASTGFKNCTMTATQFSMSTSAAATSVTPSVAGLTNGNICGAWQDGTSILTRVMTPTGTAVFSPMKLDPVVSTAQNSPSAAGLTGGKCLVVYTNSTSGTNAIPVFTFNPDGTGLVSSLLYSGSTSVAAPWATALTSGNAQVCWSGSSLVCVEVTPSATTVGSPSAINLSGAPLGGPIVAGLSGGNATVIYSHGLYTILGRSTQGAAGIGPEYTLPNTTTVQIIDFAIGGAASNPGLTSNTALTAWSDGLVQVRLTGSAAQPLSSVILASTNPGVGNPIGSESVAGLTDGSGDYFVSWVNSNNGNVEGRGISFQAPSTTSPAPTSTAAPTTSSPAPTSTSPAPTSTGTPAPTSTGPAPTTSSPAPTNTGTSSPITTSPSPTATGTQAPTSSGTPHPTSSAASALSPSSYLLPILSGIVGYLWR